MQGRVARGHGEVAAREPVQARVDVRLLHRPVDVRLLLRAQERLLVDLHADVPREIGLRLVSVNVADDVLDAALAVVLRADLCVRADKGRNAFRRCLPALEHAAPVQHLLDAGPFKRLHASGIRRYGVARLRFRSAWRFRGLGGRDCDSFRRNVHRAVFGVLCGRLYVRRRLRSRFRLGFGRIFRIFRFNDRRFRFNDGRGGFRLRGGRGRDHLALAVRHGLRGILAALALRRRSCALHARRARRGGFRGFWGRCCAVCALRLIVLCKLRLLFVSSKPTQPKVVRKTPNSRRHDDSG